MTDSVDALFSGAPQVPAAPAAPQDPHAAVDSLFADVQSAPQSAPKPSGPDWGPWGNAIASGVVRPLITGVTALPGMAADAAVGLSNFDKLMHQRLFGKPTLSSLITGNSDPKLMELPSKATADLVNRYIPQSQGTGKVAETVDSLLLGAKMPSPSVSLPTLPKNYLGDLSNSTSEAVSRALGGIGSAFGLTPAQVAAQQAGKNLGMRLTPGEETGSKPLRQIETWAQSHPWTSAPFARIARGNQDALNRVAARSIGENSENVDSTVLGRANERLGDVFESVRTPNRIVVTDPAKTKTFLDELDSENSGLLPGDMSIRDNKLVAQVDSLLGKGGATAKQLGQLSSKLGKSAFKQMTQQSGDRDLGKALYAVKDHVDDALESGLSGDELRDYRAARGEYRNLMNLTARSNVVNPSTGNVNGVALASRLQQADRPGFLFGRNTSPLYEGARFAQAFKPLVGDSGTATRLANPFDPLELAAGIPANLAARFYLSAPGRALARSAARGIQNGPAIGGRTARGLLTNPVLARLALGQ